jgi:hypothetical protein
MFFLNFKVFSYMDMQRQDEPMLEEYVCHLILLQ